MQWDDVTESRNVGQEVVDGRRRVMVGNQLGAWAAVETVQLGAVLVIHDEDLLQTQQKWVGLSVSLLEM